MTQKAQKTQAARNSATLKRTHLISLGVYLSFFLLRALLFTRRLLPFFLLVSPALIIEFWFERIGRPTYAETVNGKELKRAGEDLEAKGLTEWMWDVLYWTWGCTVLATLFGDKVWWLYIAVPLYSGYLAFTTYTGMRQGFAGMSGGADGDSAGSGGPSKRQAKMEKRGGQRVQYR